MLGREGTARRLLYGQRVHVAAKGGGLRLSGVKVRQNAAGGERLYARAQSLEMRKHIRLRPGQVEPHFRDAVQGAPVAAESFEHVRPSMVILFVILACQH